ncbi:hypothetical protein HJC23_010905 [Cyclotella cryptica]|uniref:Polymerase nucleotidyl transferase domain-containing protein n=1 Tax=Cyclotella cryptica TaxID=29204 RepID=A0ABD3Q8T6_9STRA
MTKAKTSDSSNESESMGRSDDEDSFPMKAPAPVNRSDGSSFLDEDFLSFETHQAGDSRGDLNFGNSSSKRGRSNSPVPRFDSRGRTNSKNITVPWIDAKRTSQLKSQQPHQQSNSGRGYGNTNFNSSFYEPPALVQLHNEIVSFVKLMEPTKDELEIRNKMVAKVTDLAQRVFGMERCQVLPFGSQVTGLCLPDSDIDFVIRFPKKGSTDGNAKSASKVIRLDDTEEEDCDFIASNPLHKFAEAVREEFGIRSEFDDAEQSTKTLDDENEEHLSYLEVIEQTRVPLVKFTVEPYKIDIDVCFDQPGGPESADLMHRFMNSMPPLRPLTFVLKYFLSSRDINKPFTGGIGSYLLQLMIVSFLQQRSREDLMRTGRLGNYFNLGSLLIDFFELYGIDFNYVTTGISVRNDGFYFAKGERDKKSVFWQPSRQSGLAVENPLDITMDVGAGAYRIQMIQRVFEHSFKTLLAYVAEPREETYSILARIIPPTEAMEKRRVQKMESEAKAAVVNTFNNNNTERDLQDRNSRKKRKANGHDSNNKQAKHNDRGNERSISKYTY